MKTIINWKVFFILWIASLLAAVAVLPYTLSMQAPLLEKVQLPYPLPVIVALGILQSSIMFAIAIFVGMLFAKQTTLGMPILEAATRGERTSERIRHILPLSILSGILGALFLLGLEYFVFQPAMVHQLGEAVAPLNLRTGQPAAWKGLLASFYGGVTEELLLRLFVMSLFVWLGHFISRTADGKPTAGVIWIANILAAVLFGLGHLPTVAAALVPLTPLVITRTLILNGVLGIVFGWLYWKHGLEAAMISHFSADLVLHVLLAL